MVLDVESRCILKLKKIDAVEVYFSSLKESIIAWNMLRMNGSIKLKE
jgi:hypothetical protein